MERVNLKNPSNPIERGLIKGALRRVFSRSDLRRAVINDSSIKGYHDPKRKRVTKWSKCPECKQMTPTYQMQVDHISPVIKVNETLESITWDQLVDRLWCDKKNLLAMCKECHTKKTKEENKLRRQFKKEQGK